MRPAFPPLLLVLGITASVSQPDALPTAVPNDNRTSAGRLEDGVLRVDLVARLAAWRPDLAVDTMVTVQAFAEAGGVPRIPGPLLRVESGGEVRITVRNDVADSVLVVRGLRAGVEPDDTLRVAPGATREVRYRAGAPGTYLYWGTTTGKTRIADRSARDGQLTGAIVVDAPGVRRDARERIFVMTVIDIVPDSTKPPPHEDIWELAINGLAWPHTEPLEYDVGDTVRWRWLNGSYLPHPMHLHGFHFRVLAKGDGMRDRTLPPEEVRHAVTEFMLPGSTFAMDWVPTRAGSWLFHCHMAPHISPYPARPDSAQQHDVHDLARHPKQGMAGLVLGITTVQRTPVKAAPPPRPAQHLRLLAQERSSGKATSYGYVLAGSTDPARDSIQVPGPVLLLRRGETTAITVVNRTRSHTTVHWHGMELESVYDGVAGWSATDGNLAPLILPGDSFTVSFTPPRAGTYIYHTHMDESRQLGTGMYGALLVLEPGERYDPARDLIFMTGGAVEHGEEPVQTINSRSEPAPVTVQAGTTYRVRIINILPAAPLQVSLVQDSLPLAWRAVSKDGAMLPAALRRVGPAKIGRIGVGETYDFEWTPARAGQAELQFLQAREGWMLRQPLRIQ